MFIAILSFALVFSIVVLVHEFGHLAFENCEEYLYSGDPDSSSWKEKNDRLNNQGYQCPNSYPRCCEDHPDWEVDKKGYLEYLEQEKVGKNCAAYGFQAPSCMGSVCTPVEGKKHCRSAMGPAISSGTVPSLFENSLEIQLPV